MSVRGISAVSPDCKKNIQSTKKRKGIKLVRNYGKQDKTSINEYSKHPKEKENETISIEEQAKSTSQDENNTDISHKTLISKPLKQEECQCCAMSKTEMIQLKKKIEDLNSQIYHLKIKSNENTIKNSNESILTEDKTKSILQKDTSSLKIEKFVSEFRKKFCLN